MARKNHTSCNLKDKESRADLRPSTRIKARPQKRLGSVLNGIVLVMVSLLMQTAQQTDADCTFRWVSPIMN